MDPSISFPYLTIREGIAFRNWDISVDDDAEHQILKGEISSWDYQKDFKLRLNMSIDSELMLGSCSLNGTDAEVSIIVSLVSGASRKVSRTAFNRVISQSESDDLAICIPVRSSDLSGSLRLISEIIMTNPPSDPSPLAPTVKGSRLWSHETVVDLEGSLSRFPMEVCDFTETFSDRALSDAFWYLNWYPDDPDASFLGSVRLMLNSRKEEQLKRIENGDPETITILLADIATQMSTRLLQDENFCEQYPDFASESIGGVVSEWLGQLFPVSEATAIRQALNSDPAKFSASMQSLMIFADD